MENKLRIHFLFAIFLLLCHTSIEDEKVGMDDSHGGSALLSCNEGEYLSEGNRESKQDSCSACPPNTYMSANDHRNPKCQPCDQPKSNREIVTVACTPTSNTVLGCPPEFFKVSTHVKLTDFICMACRHCPSENPPKFVGRPCEDTENTVCCDEPLMDVVDGKCVNPTLPATTCLPGQYESWRASQPNSTSVCLPCTNCSSMHGAIYKARLCGRYTDAVCCPDRRMEAVHDLETDLYKFKCQLPTHEHTKAPKEDDHTDRSTTSQISSAKKHDRTSTTAPCINASLSDNGNRDNIIIGLVVLLAIFILTSVILGVALCYFTRGTKRRRRVSFNGVNRTPGVSSKMRRRSSLIKNAAYDSEEHDVSFSEDPDL